MFRLEKRKNLNNTEYLWYVSDRFIEPTAVVEALEGSDFPIKNIYLGEDADVGLKFFDGYYSVEEFKKRYPEVKNYVDRVRIFMKYGCSVTMENNTMFVVFPSDISFDINKYINLR